VSALICGSIAFDSVMVFQGRFRDHILPDRIHLLNVSFLVPSLRRNFGGCAGNIAYNLALLGGSGSPMATVGHDFAPYGAWLRERSVDLTHVRVIDDEYTAQAFITTDLDDNQITAFHPGAMGHSHVNRGAGSGGHHARGRGAGRSRRHGAARAQFAEAGVPLLFDPGQGLPMFGGQELLDFVAKSTWIAVNDYEGQLLVERTGFSLRAAGAARARADRHAGRRGQRHSCRRPPDPDPGRAPRGHRRSHRLR
jgi:adenosine kinase